MIYITTLKKAISIGLAVTVILLLASCSWGVEKSHEPDLTDQPSADTGQGVVVTETLGLNTTESPVTVIPDRAEPLMYNEYDISMEYFPDTGTVTGIEKVTYKNRTGVDIEKLYFNVYLNAFSRGAASKSYFPEFVDKIYSNGYDYGYMNIIYASVDKDDAYFELNGTVLSVMLNAPLKPGGEIDLQIYFQAYIPKISHRTGSNDYAAWFGNFFPILAVYDENGWHTEPYYPAGDPFYSNISNYRVKITAPSGYIAVGPGDFTIYESGDKTVTTFSTKLVRDFAFAISDGYIRDSILTDDGVVISLYHYGSLENSVQVLETAKLAVEYYGDALATYPYATLDIVETELFMSGGVAYPKVIFFDSDFLGQPDKAEEIVHEIGHQWFYGVIGNNQTKEPWLDEGLTSYIQFGALYDKAGIKEKMERDYARLVEELKGYENKTLLQDLSVYTSLDEYRAVNYTRAALMIYALNLKMGDEKFADFLKLYYIRFSFKIVKRNDFIAVAEEAYGGGLEDFFSKWMSDYSLPPLE